jgi:DNA-binding transcriptional ArsR family regulator
MRAGLPGEDGAGLARSLTTSAIAYIVGAVARALAHSSVFFAIADPTRRAILDTLREGDRTVGELFATAARAVGRMTQSAFSQHLAVLRAAGIVRSEKAGTFRRYRLNPQPLAEVVDWAAHYSRFWDQRLDRLDRYIAHKAGAPARRKR